MEDYGNAQSRRRDIQKDHSRDLAKKENDPRQYEPKSAEDVPMQLEERNIGAVSWDNLFTFCRTPVLSELRRFWIC